jgi:ACS family hexuronate transporter-like MFS transporter
MSPEQASLTNAAFPSVTQRARYGLLVLVICAAVLNYVDRQIIAVLKPMISSELGWSDSDYGRLASLFQLSAALAYVFTGRLVDRLGVKWANPAGVAAWSVAALAHGFAHTFGQFSLARVALGATESMGTPAAVKTIGSLFNEKTRSVAFGISNGATTLGAIVTPLLLPVIAARVGWRASFMIAGALGLVWSVAWLVFTRKIDFGRSDRAAVGEVPSYGSIVRERSTWGIIIAKALSDQNWWLLLFWAPDFFYRVFGLTTAQLGVPLAIVYTCSGLGSLFAGMIGTALLRRGVHVNTVRKATMLVSAILVMPVPLAVVFNHYWLAVGLLGVTLAAHQGFSVSVFSTITDIVEPRKVGSVTSLGALAGNLAGMFVLFAAGELLQRGSGYLPILLWVGSSYLLALALLHVIIPRLESVDGRAAA